MYSHLYSSFGQTNLSGQSLPGENIWIMRPLELLLERVDLLVTEARAIPLKLPFQAEARLIVVRAPGHASCVAVVTAAIRLVRVCTALQFRYYETSNKIDFATRERNGIRFLPFKLLFFLIKFNSFFVLSIETVPDEEKFVKLFYKIGELGRRRGEKEDQKKMVGAENSFRRNGKLIYFERNDTTILVIFFENRALLYKTELRNYSLI